MVKGTTKRVVVVKSPDPKVFEQAIFIVKEDFMGKSGSNQEDIFREAERVADEYVKNCVCERKSLVSRIPPPLFAAAGAAAAGLAFIVLKLLGVL